MQNRDKGEENLGEEEAHPRVRTVKVDGEKRLATINLTPGTQVYGERIIKVGRTEYRLWNAFRSKLAAALIKGLNELPLREGSRVLYLGVSTGTTASHVSDIVGSKGILFGIEVAPRVAREFIDNVVKHRRNIIPIVADAREPEKYSSIYDRVDVLYCDIAQPDQTEIAIKNASRYLIRRGHILLIVKARSINVTKDPKQIFKQEEAKLKDAGFIIRQVVGLEPYDKGHALIHAIVS